MISKPSLITSDKISYYYKQRSCYYSSTVKDRPALVDTINRAVTPVDALYDMFSAHPLLTYQSCKDRVIVWISNSM